MIHTKEQPNFVSENPKYRPSEALLMSPMYTATRTGADVVVAWVDVERPEQYMVHGYTPVRGEEVEVLTAEHWTPATKDIGMYREWKKGEEVRVGKMVLMKTTKTARDNRAAAEARRLDDLRAKTNSKEGEQELENREQISTIGDETKRQA